MIISICKTCKYILVCINTLSYSPYISQNEDTLSVTTVPKVSIESYISRVKEQYPVCIKNLFPDGDNHQRSDFVKQRLETMILFELNRKEQTSEIQRILTTYHHNGHLDNRFFHLMTCAICTPIQEADTSLLLLFLFVQPTNFTHENLQRCMHSLQQCINNKKISVLEDWLSDIQDILITTPQQILLSITSIDTKTAHEVSGNIEYVKTSQSNHT